MDDIETILNTLIYDGKVEMTIIAAKEGTVGSVDGQVKLYRGVNAIIQPTGMVRTPCGLCPVSELATELAVGLFLRVGCVPLARAYFLFSRLCVCRCLTTATTAERSPHPTAST